MRRGARGKGKKPETRRGKLGRLHRIGESKRCDVARHHGFSATPQNKTVVSLTCANGREMRPRTTHSRQVTIQGSVVVVAREHNRHIPNNQHHMFGFPEMQMLRFIRRESPREGCVDVTERGGAKLIPEPVRDITQIEFLSNQT